MQYYIVMFGLSSSNKCFPDFLTQDMIFGKKKVLNIKCVFVFLFLRGLSQTFLTLRIIKRDVIIKVLHVRLKVRYPLFLSDFSDI